MELWTSSVMHICVTGDVHKFMFEFNIYEFYIKLQELLLRNIYQYLSCVAVPSSIADLGVLQQKTTMNIYIYTYIYIYK